jgi:hypothetical protein
VRTAPKVSFVTGPLLTRQFSILEFSRDCSEIAYIYKFRIRVQRLFEYCTIPKNSERCLVLLWILPSSLNIFIISLSEMRTSCSCIPTRSVAWSSGDRRFSRLIQLTKYRTDDQRLFELTECPRISMQTKYLPKIILRQLHSPSYCITFLAQLLQTPTKYTSSRLLLVQVFQNDSDIGFRVAYKGPG